MARLGPFEAAPTLAVAVSGGPDSLALALLARDWAAALGGTVLALVVDHGLRAESGDEARLTLSRLALQSVPAHLIQLQGLEHGAALAERARTARFAALAGACAGAGILHLLLGHHRRDQAETLRMRERSGSGPRGLASMAPLTELGAVRLLRPLLNVAPAELRALLVARGVPWVEDPSNHDLATLRGRLRAEMMDPTGEGGQVARLAAEAGQHGATRAGQDVAVAAVLSVRVQLHPAGWALLSPGPLPVPALNALLCCIAGRQYPLPRTAVGALATAPRTATLGGARLVPARHARGWLVLREAAAMQSPVPARMGAIWDGRFRIAAPPGEHGLMLGAVGQEAVSLRSLWPDWPSALLQTLPALWRGNKLVSVPALADPGSAQRSSLVFEPAMRLAGAPFLAM